MTGLDAATARGSTGEIPSCPPLRVFVVENHEDTRALLCLLLEQMGHTVFSCASMGDALKLIPESNCDVLICDIGLPDGDGWELLRRLEVARPLYAVAVSGYGMNADRAKSKAVGFRHHLVKPTGHEQLVSILQKAAEEIATTARADVRPRVDS